MNADRSRGVVAADALDATASVYLRALVVYCIAAKERNERKDSININCCLQSTIFVE